MYSKGPACLFYVQSHRSNDRHPIENVTTAINNLMGKLSSSLVAVSDMALIIKLCTRDKHGVRNGDEASSVWADED